MKDNTITQTTQNYLLNFVAIRKKLLDQDTPVSHFSDDTFQIKKIIHPEAAMVKKEYIDTIPYLITSLRRICDAYGIDQAGLDEYYEGKRTFEKKEGWITFYPKWAQENEKERVFEYYSLYRFLLDEIELFSVMIRNKFNTDAWQIMFDIHEKKILEK